MNKETKQDKIMERFIANAKQETLEEVAERFTTFCTWGCKKSFIEGAKWQQEQDAKEIQLLREEISYLKRNKL